MAPLCEELRFTGGETTLQRPDIMGRRGVQMNTLPITSNGNPKGHCWNLATK